ncbi:MAG: hypothetical protein JNK49_05320 [Planctomycetes bacterium]|nr:hypothetical protein [Planctomycetota bacterium]
MFANFALFASLALATSALAQNAPVYGGTGGLYDQRVGAIQANSTLTPNGSITLQAGGSNRRIYVRFLATTDRNADGFELAMRSLTGQLVRPASLWSANSNGNPAASLVQGVIGITGGTTWCQASFDRTYRITGGNLYFMAFDLNAGEAVELQTTTAPNYRTVAYFTSAGGTVQFAPLRYRVDTDASRLRATSGAIGLGASNVPTSCTGMPAWGLGALFFGVSNAAAPEGLLPRLPGAPFVRGSVQYISFDYLPFAGYADGSGRLTCFVSYTSNPAMLGFTFYQQWAGLVGSDTWALSNYARLTL